MNYDTFVSILKRANDYSYRDWLKIDENGDICFDGNLSKKSIEQAIKEIFD